ncbi:MAG: hypothetical protein ACXAD7_15425 [Candidatus Kariarchaeaceae archaeon]|jgi:methionine synthase II (cobalamin-independent)
MTNIRGSLAGTHPLGEELIQAILDFKYGRAEKDKVKKLFHNELVALIRLQEDLEAFPMISTGNFGIEDLIRPFVRSLRSLRSYDQLGDLPINRYHFTNTFYRQPTIIEKLPNTASVILEDTHSLSDESSFSHDYLQGKQGKLVLPGPVSFSTLINRGSLYPDFGELIESSGRYLAAEISTLPAQYREIQFDEPSLVWDRIPRTLRPSILVAYEVIVKAAAGKNTIISTYFESCENILSFLLDLPVSGIGIDFRQTNILALSEHSFEGKILQAGLLDSQNFVPTDTGQLDTSKNNMHAKFASSLLEFNPQELIITSTTGLEYLPREIADQRLLQISEIVKLVQEN